MDRWLAEITYRTAGEPLVVPHDIEELDEIADLVERGPDWNTIARIEITLQRVGSPGMTVEQDTTQSLTAKDRARICDDLHRKMGRGR